MDIGLKLLIAAACAVVIAVGGYWGWGEYNRNERAREAAEFQAARQNCIQRAKDTSNGAPFEDNTSFLAACLMFGYLRDSDLKRLKNEAIGRRANRAHIGDRNCIDAADGLRSYMRYEAPGVGWSKEHLIRTVSTCLANGRIAATEVEDIAHMLPESH